MQWCNICKHYQGVLTAQIPLTPYQASLSLGPLDGIQCLHSAGQSYKVYSVNILLNIVSIF